MAIQGQQGAIWMPVPAANIFPGYWGNTPRWVVIHKTASGGTAQDIAHFFQNDPAKASTHYIVGQDGTIVQCVDEANGAGGNCCLEAGHASYLPTGVNMNVLTISIEHVDPASDNSTPLTSAQKLASFRLVQGICQRHNIPMRAGDANGGIIGHHDISPISRRLCPNNYPMADLLNYLKGNTSMPVPTNWKNTDTTLTAPNGVPVVLGFRDYILNAASWDAANQPLEPEYHANQVLLHNAAVGAGQRQMFRDTMLWYTPAAGVREEPYLGWELDAAYKQIDQLKAQLAAQTTPIPNIADAITHIEAAQAAAGVVATELGKALPDLKQ